MPQVDIPQTLQIGGKPYPYTAVSVHRNGNIQQKSQWLVEMDEEVSCFERTVTKGWVDGGVVGWGIKPNTFRGLEVIGRDKVTSDLKIAKFVGSGGHWHGYPINHSEGPRYRPDERILREWMADGILDKAKMAKLKSGKRCSL